MEKVFGFSVDEFDGEKEMHYTPARVIKAESVIPPPVDETDSRQQEPLDSPSDSSANDTVIRYVDEDLTQVPRKRSASDASLANSGSEVEVEKKASRKDELQVTYGSRREEGPRATNGMTLSSAETFRVNQGTEGLEASVSIGSHVTQPPEDLPDWLDPAERPVTVNESTMCEYALGPDSPSAQRIATPVSAKLRKAFLDEILHIEPRPPPRSTNQPSFDMVDGHLVLDCPSDLAAAKWKITITLYITLQKGHPDGWSNLVVPGLPKFKEDDRGIFLFQVPESKAIEFRTTHLQDYTIIEDSALFAHFYNPESLVIPMRICDSYPRLKDFTVDQQIKGQHLFKKVGDDIIWTMKYHALCSLRLHNHCFLAKYCTFDLYLDGGPECFYRCRVDSDDTGVPNLTLESGNKGIGRSAFEISCPPRALGKFCLSWEVSSTDLTGGFWLPRVSSSSALGDSRDSLREGFGFEDTRYVEVEEDTDQRKKHKKRRARKKKHKKLEGTDGRGYDTLLGALYATIIIFLVVLVARSWSPLWSLEDSSKCRHEGPSGLGNGTELALEEVAPSSSVTPLSTKRQEVGWRSPGLSLIDRFDYFLGWRPPNDGDYPL